MGRQEHVQGTVCSKAVGHEAVVRSTNCSVRKEHSRSGEGAGRCSPRSERGAEELGLHPEGNA